MAAVVVAGLLASCSDASAGGGATPGSSRSAPAEPSATARATAPAAGSVTTAATDASFDGLEKHYAADLGVYAVDVRTGRTLTYSADERFAFASTYKALAAGILLDRESDAQLAGVVHYSSAALVDYSPVTEKHVATGMTLHDLIAAALQYSDNTAANLLLDRLGGPAGLQAALRALGDGTTNVDRPEPDVNAATPGDPRDTTTARAIGVDLRGFVLGHVLTASRRGILRDLMLGNTTGAPWIRAGVPAGWTVADKTGNGGYGTRDDVAVAYRPDGDPVVISLLSDRGVAGAASDDALLAEATRVVVNALG